MKRKYIILLSIIPALIVLLLITAMAMGINPIFMNVHDNIAQPEGKALAGYDPLSYRDGNPQMGSPDHVVEWNGANWYFTSEENKQAFAAEPEKYCPAFGGHCALATSTGFAVSGDPSAYAIIQDTLYIFAEEAVKESYLKDADENIKQSRAQWNR